MTTVDRPRFDVEKARNQAAALKTQFYPEGLPHRVAARMLLACDEIESLRRELAASEEMSAKRFAAAVQWQQERDRLRERERLLLDVVEAAEAVHREHHQYHLRQRLHDAVARFRRLVPHEARDTVSAVPKEGT